MAKFRKRPVTVEAIQWLPGVEHPGACHGPCELNDYLDTRLAAHLHTMHKHQTVYIEYGDWILAEPDGERFYPCKPDVFAATYERVEEEPTNGA